MGMVSEFKEFIAKGNVLDLAVAVVIGAAFGRIVTALVDGIVMPLVSLVTGGGTAGFWGSIAVAFVGAVILIFIVRALPGRSPV